MITREQARNLTVNMGGTLTTSCPSVFTGGIPVRTELTVLGPNGFPRIPGAWDADDPWEKKLGWTYTENIGMAVVNPLAVVKIVNGKDWEADDPYGLTNEEKRQKGMVLNFKRIYGNNFVAC